MNPAMQRSATLSGGRGVPRLDANMGGPMSRSRSERVRSSLLGKDDGAIRCPRMIRLGLEFARGDDPVAVMANLLAGEGYGSPEDLRDAFPVPAVRLICRPLPADGARLKLCAGASPADILAQALLLGLCSSTLYDPARPVLWTQASLTRGLELFDPAGFYA